MATEAAGIDRPLLVDDFLQRRRYQLQLADAAADEHTLVCLPTGLGKTTVSLLVTVERLHEAGGKALFLAPTKPLVQQHADFYREALEIPDDEIVVFTGDVKPDDRAALWDDARIAIATPQVVENDLVGNRISLRDVTHLTFDECHRATGDYAYVYIAERYHADAADPLVTGMSASPGGDTEEIETVCENLGLVNVEVMTEEDADVDKYTHDTDVQWEQVTLPDEVLAIRDALNEVITDRLEKLKQLGVTNTTNPDLSQKDLNKMRGQLKQMMDNDQSEGYKGMSTHAEVMKLRRATELVETQSVESVRRYFERQREAARSSGASKASQRMVADPKVREAMRKAESFDGLHPKFSKARILLAETLGINEGERAILFTESRDTAEALVEFLSASFDVRKFVGQGDKDGSDGMSQKQQQETLDEFKAGEFEVLVSTSVAEEGLDVPEVDLVCFYEPVPTAIRSIQRKGRTGRQAEGKVVVLMAEDTRDEAFFWISRRREKKMASQLAELKEATDDIEESVGDEGQAGLDAFAGGSASEGDSGEGGSGDDQGEAEGEVDGDDEGEIGGDDEGDAGLTDFAAEAREGEDDVDDVEAEADGETEVEGETDAGDDGVVATAGVDEGVEVVVDQRELDSSIAKDLSTRDGLVTRLETLAVGDYVLSDRVAVERKSAADFVDSMLDSDRSMFEQVGELSRAYARPVMVVEGTNLYGQRDIDPNAIRGALASLAVDFDVSVLRTEGEEDTTELLATIAKREQETRDREVSVHGEKTTKTRAEQQEYVVSSIADIGPVTARTLLEHFGTVEAVMTAPEDDLLDVDGVGPVTAERIREVVGTEYE
ncbi:DEAD/DEAH box helicase [Halorubrum ezzemoulense]|uniref:DEAD/DEAH box helicase n=1 Tax=Halorubrum ezzemoulense TaxID=337243 RepID=A0ABT4Z2F1_HALEZ|nr:DEAD/DEAH box helicase [Halorubrum ezzemoulense]MDB2244101.1 DEAD/DEAH box helicase [Halorubrum ezzemoulense]MDB2277837.1 DEAD/DEAH box helicase [Halorubrum ezzemoulense]MDB2289464.1 DEAD/DEAH box helicase [Halorubrum ezzemoulense]MDB2292328.1 DEAD/DEAH box helicase [Halorubrum ezzemoulense]MDB2296934.1 DEAD/DEAH box helicase [Halorubrum ezzemoulense]